MLTRMVSISWPRDPPASASQSAGITGVSHCTQPLLFVFFFLKKERKKEREREKGEREQESVLLPRLEWNLKVGIKNLFYTNNCA